MKYPDILLAEILNSPRAVQIDIIVRMFDDLTSAQQDALMDYMKKKECITDNCKNQGIFVGTCCLVCMQKQISN